MMQVGAEVVLQFLSQVVTGHDKFLSCIGEAANMCMSSVVVDLSVCESSGTCSDCGGYYF
jgi:hypothetical protein